MDFRIITLAQSVPPILLERIDDDGKWVVFISAFLNMTDRYEEWYKQNTPVEARNFIIAYTQSQATDFMDRANTWYERIESDRRKVVN